VHVHSHVQVRCLSSSLPTPALSCPFHFAPCFTLRRVSFPLFPHPPPCLLSPLSPPFAVSPFPPFPTLCRVSFFPFPTLRRVSSCLPFRSSLVPLRPYSLLALRAQPAPAPVRLAGPEGSPRRWRCRCCAVIVASVLLLIFALFGGFLVDKREITWVLRWICYVSPTR